MSKKMTKGKAKDLRKKVFAKAIDVIFDKGWVQGAFHTNRGVCAVESVRVAAKQLGGEAAKQYGTFDGHGLIAYNDSEDRTKYQVIVKLAKIGGLV